jgi:phage terminase large subunit GpA-like protein
MIKEVNDNLLDIFTHVSQPYSGSIASWAHDNVKLPEIYGQPGRLDLTTSPWLIPPLEDVLNPKVTTVIKIMAVRVGKSLTDDITIPYWISQSPGPILRVHQDDDAASVSVETRLLPILRTTEAVAPLLPNKKGIKKGLINLPNSFIRYGGDKESIAHSIGVRYLILDEAHLYDSGMIEKL